MAKTTTIVKIDRQGARRTLIRVRGGGYKTELEIPGGLSELRLWIRSQIEDSHSVLVALALRQWLEKNPDSADFSAIEGKQLTLDFAATNIVTINP